LKYNASPKPKMGMILSFATGGPTNQRPSGSDTAAGVPHNPRVLFAAEENAKALICYSIMARDEVWPKLKSVPLDHIPDRYRELVSVLQHMDSKGQSFTDRALLSTAAVELGCQDVDALKGDLDDILYSTSPEKGYTGVDQYVQCLADFHAREEAALTLDSVNRLVREDKIANDELASRLEGATVSLRSAAEGRKRPVDVDAWLKAPAPPLQCLFEDKVPYGAIAGISAAGGRGKGWFTQELIVSVTIGRSLFPSWEPTSQRKVLWLESEDYQDELHRRFEKISRIFDLTRGERKDFAKNLVLYADTTQTLASLKNGVVTPTDDYAWLEAEVRKIQPGFIVVDPLSHFFGGDENDNIQVGRWMALLKNLATTVNRGAVVWVNHHVSKTNQNSPTSAAGRGASAGRDAQRAVFSMVSEERGGKRLTVVQGTKANWTKTPGKTYLETNTSSLNGGVLKEVSLDLIAKETAESLVDRVAHRLPELVRGHQGSLTENDLVRETRGKPIRTQLTTEFGKEATQEVIRSALAKAVKDETISVEKVGRGGSGRKASVLKVGTPISSAETNRG
jgi:AAA domain-containing protein